MNNDELNIIFLGNFCQIKSEERFKKYSKVGLPGGMMTLSRDIVSALEMNHGINVNIIYGAPLGWFPKYSSLLYIKSKDLSHNGISKDKEISFLNLPVIKEWCKRASAKKRILDLLEVLPNQKTVIMIQGLCSSYIYAGNDIKRYRNDVEICTFIGDLPNKYTFLSSMPKFEMKMKQLYGKRQIKSLKFVDKFIFCCKGIAEVVGFEKKHIILDNIAETNIPHIEKADEYNTRYKDVLYTGALIKDYGLLRLLDAFSLIKGKNYRLIICGDGELREEVKKRASIDKRIIYKGYITKNEIYQLQKRSTVLVNPRTGDLDFTKYSFPSKTTEYLASGVPMIGYQLEGIGEEYYEYLNSPKSNSINDLSSKIIEICELSKAERFQLGTRARSFIINNKSKKIQSSKILTFIKDEE